MKTTRKLLAMVLAVIMVMSLATTAFAADITITGGASGSEYAAYKLLNATDGGDGKFAYTLNDKYDEILKAVTGKSTEADIVAYISGLNADGIRDFADAVYAKIVAAKLAADYTTKNDKFTGVAQGYYLIAETKVGNAADTFSLVMLDTAGANNIEVATKEDVPEVDKQVEEKNDTTGASSWGDTADYDVGDTINYKITGTVSSKYADYKNYDYMFTDTMSKGLTYNEDAKVYVVNGDSKVEVTSQFTITNTANGFTAYANLKKLTGVTINSATEIVVEYTATLNENAVSGSAGNLNTVTLKYENDPYNGGDGTPDGETPPDTNIVFTYDAIVNKTDKDGNALAGAGFTLYKYVNNAWVQVGDQITGKTTFEFKKLDEGKYKLVETTVPAGYNKADDVEFEIISTLDDEDEKLDNLVVSPADAFTVNMTDGSVTTNVTNYAGSELPTTGGMGTTLFYILGSVMVLAAVVLLVTKRRMNNAE